MPCSCTQLIVFVIDHQEVQAQCSAPCSGAKWCGAVNSMSVILKKKVNIFLASVPPSLRLMSPVSKEQLVLEPY